MDRTCELLALESFSGYISSSACIENRNHFHRHRDQILIGSLVNSKQVNGENCKKKHLQPGCRCTCTLAITTSPPQKKLAGSASTSGMVSGKSGVDHPVATPLVTAGMTTYRQHLLFVICLFRLSVTFIICLCCYHANGE